MGVSHGRAYKQHQSHYADKEGPFRGVSPPRFEASRRVAECPGLLKREGWRLARWLSRFNNFGRSGLLHPIWRTIQCQSPSETELLHSSESSVKRLSFTEDSVAEAWSGVNRNKNYFLLIMFIMKHSLTRWHWVLASFTSALGEKRGTEARDRPLYFTPVKDQQPSG